MAVTLTNMILATLRRSGTFLSRGELMSSIKDSYDIELNVVDKADEMARNGLISRKRRGMMGYFHYIHNNYATQEAMS